MSGRLSVGFERAEFAGCWLDISSEAWRDMGSLLPAFDRGILTKSRMEIDLEMIGRRTLARPRPPTPSGPSSTRHGYGHMSVFPCQIEAVRILSTRMLSYGAFEE